MTNYTIINLTMVACKDGFVPAAATHHEVRPGVGVYPNAASILAAALRCNSAMRAIPGDEFLVVHPEGAAWKLSIGAVPQAPPSLVVLFEGNEEATI